MADGQTVGYLQLAHNEWDPVAKVSRTKVLYSFGREDQLDRDALGRLVSSICRFLDPVQAVTAAAGAEVVLTSDHGSILCERPVTVFARRDATANLRYKFGQDLRAESPSAVFAVNDESALRFPPGRLATNYLIGLEDYFFVYPTKLREYQARYRGSFLHGGASPEEMILPVATLRPR